MAKKNIFIQKLKLLDNYINFMLYCKRNIFHIYFVAQAYYL